MSPPYGDNEPHPRPLKRKKDNEDVKAMLLRIKRDCIEDYPYVEGDPIIDSRYVLVMGYIAGLVTEAIQAVQQDRPIRLDTRVP